MLYRHNLQSEKSRASSCNHPWNFFSWLQYSQALQCKMVTIMSVLFRLNTSNYTRLLPYLPSSTKRNGHEYGIEEHLSWKSFTVPEILPTASLCVSANKQHKAQSGSEVLMMSDTSLYLWLIMTSTQCRRSSAILMITVCHLSTQRRHQKRGTTTERVQQSA